MDEKKELTKIVEKISNILGEIEDEAFSKGELSAFTVKQIYYLDVISRTDKPTVSQLAEKLDVSKPTVTVALKKFIKRGYLRKIQSKSDRRVFFIELTEEGKKLVEIHENAHKDFACKIIQNLDDSETQQLIKIFSKLLRKV